jgi:hypothetical protein
MNSPETSGNLDRAIDPSLLELDGTTYKDLSPSASAKRAAYHHALSVKSQATLRASSSSATTREQPLSTPASNAGFSRFGNFENFGTAPGYDAEYGSQGPGQEGWIMQSNPGSWSSRLRFTVPFNDGSAPYTLIRASFRGAPDNGKDSYVALREQRCADAPPPPPGTPPLPLCDEVDIVEYYGYPPDQRSEWALFQSGAAAGTNAGSGRYPAPTNQNPGLNVYNYELYLESGNYIRLRFATRTGPILGEWERHSSEGLYVPTQPMYLYAGIWDCSSGGDPPKQKADGFCWDGSEPFQGDSWCALHALYMET